MLERYGFVINIRLNAVICQSCKIVVMAKNIKEHLLDHHQHARLPFDTKEVDNALRPYKIGTTWAELEENVKKSQRSAALPIEFEGLALWSGLKCPELGCENTRLDQHGLRAHYGRSHTGISCPEEKDLHKVYFQRFNNANATNFEVDRRQYLTQPPDDVFVEMARVIHEAVDGLNRVDSDKKMREPWLLKVRWDEFVGNRDASALVKYAGSPESREFPGLRDGLRLMATRIDGKLDTLSDLIKQKLNTEDPIKDG